MAVVVVINRSCKHTECSESMYETRAKERAKETEREQIKSHCSLTLHIKCVRCVCDTLRVLYVCIYIFGVYTLRVLALSP